MLAGYDHLLRAAERLRWDEADIALTEDAAAWPSVPAERRDRLRRLVAGFCVAERAVAEHLEPFGGAAPDPVQAACFASQADDEARHARFFARVAREVVGIDPGLEASELAGPAVVDLFERVLPEVAGDVASGGRPLAEGVALYHLVLEGIVFHTGQRAALELCDGLPGVREGVERVQADERWHVGLGVRCLADAGLDGDGVDALLARAGAAARVWGEDLVSDQMAAEVLEVHRRRLDVARSSARASPELMKR